jgi:tetratricopeptide (TPR) repeat protein
MSPRISPSYTTGAAIVSIFCGFFHALPNLGGLPSPAMLFSAARGLASMKKLAGYTPASFPDLVNAWLWNGGGPSLLVWGNWLAVFVGWTLVAFAALAVVWMVSRLLHDRRIQIILFGSTVLLLLATCVPDLQKILSANEKISHLSLLAPLELTRQVRKFSREEIFAPPVAQAHLLLFAPDVAGGISPEEAAKLVLNPPQWREALRSANWKAVLLTGPLAEYRPLLDHLITSPDWHLAALTNQGYLFLRGSGLPARSIDPETFQLSSDLETALYLAQISERYDAIRRSPDARACIDRAGKLAPDNATVLAHAATFAASHKRWQDAINLSNKALTIQPDFAQAKIVQALALLEIRQPEKAMDLVDQVLVQTPDDLYTLFLSARISKALNDHTREAETLEKIISLSTRSGLPVVNYQIYLGQAYASLGQATDALKNYRAVLANGHLNKEQAAEIQSAIDTIESRELPSP